MPIDVLPGRAVGSRMCSPPSRASWRGRQLQQRQRSSEEEGVEPPTVQERRGQGVHPRARSWASFIYTITCVAGHGLSWSIWSDLANQSAQRKKEGRR